MEVDANALKELRERWQHRHDAEQECGRDVHQRPEERLRAGVRASMAEQVVADLDRLLLSPVQFDSIERHVGQSLAFLDERMREHDALGRCTRTTDCKYCSLLALSFAALRRVDALVKRREMK